MADLGTVRLDGEKILELLPFRSGHPPIVRAMWQQVCPHNEVLCAQLRTLETGSVIDHRALIERGEVIVMRYAPTRVTEENLERLLEAAELLEGRE
jgi:DNA-binding FadR family transcriptional regulator